MSNPVVPKIKIGEIRQIGIVVRDLQKAADNYWATLGIGPWMTLRIEPPLLRDVTLRGEPVEASMLAAITQSGSIQVELIEPFEGPSIWKEFLEERGEVRSSRLSDHAPSSGVRGPNVVSSAICKLLSLCGLAASRCDGRFSIALGCLIG